MPGLGQTQLALFTAGQATIQEIDSVQGTVPGTGLGLGPRFNMDSCGGCHDYPAPGGSSPPVNPQVAASTKQNATNVVPFFVTVDGPIRHASVKSNPESGHGGTQTHLSVAGHAPDKGNHTRLLFARPRPPTSPDLARRVPSARTCTAPVALVAV